MNHLDHFIVKILFVLLLGGVNPSFRLEDESDFGTQYHYYPARQRSGFDYEHAPPPYFSRQNSYDSNTSVDRPSNLDGRLRSSLRRYYATPRSNAGGGGSNSPKISATGGGGGGSSSSGGAGTPTNPTPPDSLTSEDSSYVSAKEGSCSSSTPRVHFSPVMQHQTPTATLLDIPVIGQAQDSTVPLQALRGQTRHHHRKPSVGELEREFLS